MVILTFSDSPRSDSYSAAFTAVDGDLGQPEGTSGVVLPLSPAFNISLYLTNSRVLTRSCFSHGKVYLSYGGVAMGEGRVPGWCAGARSTAEVSAVGTFVNCPTT